MTRYPAAASGRTNHPSLAPTTATVPSGATRSLNVARNWGKKVRVCSHRLRHWMGAHGFGSDEVLDMAEARLESGL